MYSNFSAWLDIFDNLFKKIFNCENKKTNIHFEPLLAGIDSVKVDIRMVNDQGWSPRGCPWPRGHILKSLALALALASKPQVLENCPVLGSRTALFFELLKFGWKAPETSQKICEDLFLFSSCGNRLKKNF